MLGAADDEEEVEAGAEPLLPAPNKLGVGVADDEVVVLGGFLAIKEKAGFEAAVESIHGERDAFRNMYIWKLPLCTHSINKLEQVN